MNEPKITKLNSAENIQETYEKIKDIASVLEANNKPEDDPDLESYAEEIDKIIEAVKEAHKDINGDIPTAYINGGLTVVPIDEEEAEGLTKEAIPVTMACDENGNDVRIIDDKREVLKDANISILDVLDGKTEDDVDTDAIEVSAKEKFGISDEDSEALLDAILTYKSGETSGIYKMMPESIKQVIKGIAFENQIPSHQYNNIACMIVKEFLEDSDLDRAFIDFETSMADALKLPSTHDLYTAHIQEMMTTKTLELADKIRDEDPKKAEMLENISAAFTDSVEMKRMKNTLENNSRARKAMRRDVDKFKRFCDEINFRNEKTIFKMPDANLMYPALIKVLNETETNVYDVEATDGQVLKDESTYKDVVFTEDDAKKFIILFCKTAEMLDPHDVVEASYIYYAIKNISMLYYTEEGKTSFAAELINNIKDMIMHIRAKEEEFNADNSMRQLSKRDKRMLQQQKTGKRK